MDLEAELVDHIDRGDIQKVFECIYRGACLNVSIAVTNSSNKETETTPLIQAITSKISAKLSLSLAQILLLHGADPDVVAGGRVPLLEAVKLDRLEVVRLLLESGVNKEVCDEKGEDALSYARNSEHDDIQLLLLGQETKVSITFNGYVFEEMETTQNQELDKENILSVEQVVNTPSSCRVKAPTDFLLEVEKIFENDIIGTPSGATLTRQDISPVKRDIDEVAGMLQDVGFRTPRSYSAKATPVLLSSQTLSEFNSPIPKQENQGFKEKVENYLQSLENTSLDSISSNKTKTRSEKISASSDSSQEQNIDGFTTPKIPKKSYLRSTVASSAKKRIPFDPPSADKRKAKDQKQEGSNKKRKEKVDQNKLTNIKYGTISSLKTDVTGISLAKSLASSNCMTYSEEYIIKDDYCGIELIEKRIPSLHSLARQDEQLLRRLEEDGEPPLETSNNFTLGSFSDFSCGRITTELEKYGETPKGPVNSDTRKAYLIRLRKLKLGLVVPENQLNITFPGPMADSLRNISSITKKWESLWKLEEEMVAKFNQVDPKLAASINYLTRESVCKSSFNYLLLDPRKSQNLPFKIFSWGDQDLWKTFVDSIFYIGKGTRSRPFQHLYDAASKKKVTKKHAAKVSRILEVWKDGHGVVSLQVFNNSIAVEGFTREAAMIDALGLKNLTNVKCGDYYGPAKELGKDDQLKLGTFLLYRAFKIFLQEGERQIRPVDLKIALD